MKSEFLIPSQLTMKEMFFFHIYLHTDGFYDQFGGSENKKLYRNNLNKWLLGTASLSGNDQKFEIEKRFDCWKEGHDQIDDVTLIELEL